MLSALRHRLVPASVALVAAMFASVCESRLLGLGLLGLALAAVVAGPRFEVERPSQIGASFLAVVVGVLLPRVFAVEAHAPGFLSERVLLATCPALLFATTRAVLRAPSGGAPLTLAAAVIALAGAGRAPSPLYPAAVVAFAALGLAGAASTDPGRAWPRTDTRRHAAKLALALGIAAAVGVGLTASLPRLHDALIARIVERLRERSGFSTTMTLSSLDGLLRSDEVVARVRHGSPSLLRGAVFSRYVTGIWQAPSGESSQELVQTEPLPPPGAALVELEFPRRPERYFLPLEATDVVASTGQLLATRLGLRLPTSSAYAKRIWYRPGAVPPLAPPAPEDTLVPARIRATMERLSSGWAPFGAPRARLDSLVSHLQEGYEYSLTFERTAGVDPVVDFLETHRSGHCEYFASAMALLARASGVPARVVTGYRVAERARFGGYSIVRERDAHAWVEAWVDGGWVTFDPTPSAPLAGGGARATSLFAALSDLLATRWERIDDFLAARSPFELTLALVGLGGLLLLVRWLRSRRAAPAAALPLADPPLPCFAELEAALAARGLGRARHETLGAFAERLEALASPAAEVQPAPDLVRRYAELRYGDRGDEAEVRRALTELARRLGSKGTNGRPHMTTSTEAPRPEAK